MLAAVIALVVASDAGAANADRRNFPDAIDQVWYVTTATSDGDPARHRDATALRLIVASISPQPVIERATPVNVTPTLFRLDMRDLGFSVADWRRVVATYPYASESPPLMVRADWLLLQLTDAHERPEAYYPLAFGGKTPKTRDEALAILGVSTATAGRFGMIAGESGVSVQRTRWLETRPIDRGYCWGTRDVLKLDNGSDPVEAPLGDFAHDGEEWLIWRRKFSAVTGAQGVLQISFLANGKGDIVGRAPVDLVQDHTKFRGLAEIRNPGSCYQCHITGPNLPTRNELRRVIESGVKAMADYQSAQAIEAFHFADASKELRRATEDYAEAAKLATGVEPADAAGAFHAAIDSYEAPLTLERAACELYTRPEHLRDVLAKASSRGAQLPARVAGLAHGLTCPRRAWEQDFLSVRNELLKWPDRRRAEP